MNRLALVLVIIALLIGAYLRFNNLGALQMSADEGATWAAADAPSIREVVALQQTHNAGKSPLHDLMLHGWIAVFGDSVGAMRAMSALCGAIAILLMVPVTREVLRISFADRLPAIPRDDADMIAALGAIICAVGLVTIKYSREMRMYSLMLALVLAQVWIFLRALHLRGLGNYFALAVLTAAVIAVNPVSAPILATEGLWLLTILATYRDAEYRARARSALLVALSMALGLLALSPGMFSVAARLHRHVESGGYNWLPQPPIWAPAAFLNKATGSFAFPAMAALAAWGIWRGWTRAKDSLIFALLWMWTPPILLVAGSYLWRPMFIERYAIYSFPAFFILIAIGIWELDSNLARAAATVVIVILAFGHAHSYSLKTHDVDWHEAARVAQASLRPDDTAAVAPPYAVEVVRYYVYPPLRGNAVGYDPATAHSTVVILAEHGVNPAVAARVRRDYPRVLRRARGVVVLSR